MQLDDFLDAFEKNSEETHYPVDFLEKYTLMECLAERSGVDTFLVQDREGEQFVAKCYQKAVWKIDPGKDPISEIEYEGLPRQIDFFENDEMAVVVREYMEGMSLERYAQEHDLTKDEIIGICMDLCDLLGVLHHQKDPVIHRDIKPQNIIIGADGQVALIDFDIARVWQSEHDTDTYFLGTVAYAPPEQYGFLQTDARADIYSLGILLRYLLTGSPRENKNIRVYRPLAKIIEKCTAFSPKERYSDVSQVKRALAAANPRSQFLQKLKICTIAAIVIAMLSIEGIRIYQQVTYDPFSDEAIPKALNDEERIEDAVQYMKEQYHTTLFDTNLSDYATMGLVKKALIELYGLDREYVYAYQEEGELPEEGDSYFFPWNLDDGQAVRRDTMVYTAVKVHDTSIVSDWSSLKDDTGEYPGERVAVQFAQKTGIMTGANRPYDITIGEMALILANTDRVFEAAEGKISK